MRLFLAALILVGLWSGPAAAKPPRVLADIAPVHSLVSMVMRESGRPDLLISGAADPHDFQMRPSQARALARADIVFWIGPQLTPWLGDSLTTLARSARSVALLPDAPVLRRNGDAPADPHAWLDPENAIAWLDVIAGELSAADPDNASRYRQNARRAQADISALQSQLQAQLAPAATARLVSQHDALGYFADRFGLNIVASLAPTDASRPGAATLRDMRALFEQGKVACLLAEPGTGRALADNLTGGTTTRVSVLDPLGVNLAPGPGLYPALLQDLAEAILGCVTPR